MVTVTDGVSGGFSIVYLGGLWVWERFGLDGCVSKNGVMTWRVVLVMWTGLVGLAHR